MAIEYEYSDFKTIYLSTLELENPPVLFTKVRGSVTNLSFVLDGERVESFASGADQTDFNSQNFIQNKQFERVFERATFLNGSSRDMDVDGDPNPVTFSVDAPSDSNFVIRKIEFYVTDSEVRMDRYGNVNISSGQGTDITYEKDGGVTKFICEDCFDLKDFYSQGFDKYSLYDNDGRENVRNVHVYGNFKMELPYPIVLRKGTSDSVKFIIKGDIDGLNEHYAFAIGERVFV